MRQWLRGHPRLESLARVVWRAFAGKSVSRDYVQLSDEEFAERADELGAAWQSETIPMRQRALVEKELAAYKAGKKIEVFDVLIWALRDLPAQQRTTVLEIGCSTGHYSEVLSMAHLGCAYSGCDYSEKFVSLARGYYPALSFDVMDATRLGYASDSFDVAVSGCCLLHIPDYVCAIRETARVAKHHAIFHRTPVLPNSSTRVFSKMAYGVQTVEIHFGEKELLKEFESAGLVVESVLTVSESGAGEDLFAVRTYVCRKGSK